ncbi:MAG: acylase, partial [Nitrospirae bacterium]
DKRYDPESEVVRLVEEAAAAAAPDLAEESAILRRWRRTAERDDREAPLAILTAAPILFARRTGDPAPEPGEALRAASRLLREHYGRLDPTWGEVNRLRRGALDLPLGGGPDTLRAIEATRPGPDGRLAAERGDSLILFATWDASGALSLEAIHQFGSATLDPRSPHYADQAPLFAEERTRRVPMHPAELLEQRERSYRPGRRAREAGGPAGPDAAR